MPPGMLQLGARKSGVSEGQEACSESASPRKAVGRLAACSGWLPAQGPAGPRLLRSWPVQGGDKREGAPRLTELQALALSTFERFLTSVLNTFIFSTRVVRAVSVASPTFS